MQERHGDLYVCVNYADDRNADITYVEHPDASELKDFVELYDVTDPDFDYVVIRL